MLHPKVTTVPVDTACIAGDLTFLSGTIVLKINRVTEGTYGLITVLAPTFEFDGARVCVLELCRQVPPPSVCGVGTCKWILPIVIK
jgi:hypothetical protein